MNQILSFQNTENGRKIMKNNIKHLCIFLILFAICLIVMGSWRLYKNLTKKVSVIKPEIVGYINSNKTKFSVNSAVGIKKIAYSWNNGEDTIIEKFGEKNFQFEIDNRIGVNELTLKSFGVDGSTVIYEGINIVFEDETPGDDVIDMPIEDKLTAIQNDKNKPTISLTAESGKVVITASDDVMMSHVTYCWNDGEEIKITGLSNDEKTLSEKVEALKGDNVLKIKAYDIAGNVAEVERKIHGTDGPSISVKKSDDQLIVNVSDEYGITKIEYNFNNEEKTIENIEGTTYEFCLDLIDGDNFIIINAYEGNVKTEYKGKTQKS